jgi:hypothetical protein
LNQQLDDKNIEIRDIRAQVQKNNEKIHSLNKTVGRFCFLYMKDFLWDNNYFEIVLDLFHNTQHCVNCFPGIN